MRVMLLAAGRGERMRPLTETLPKPLLSVAGKALIEHTIMQLVSAGFTEMVINYAYLGHLIPQYLGDGRGLGAHICYSPEGDGALETAGGIINALPLLGERPFLVVNSDIATDFPFAELRQLKLNDDLAHLILVPNPAHHPQGDFSLTHAHRVHTTADNARFTFSGIGVYQPELFSGIPVGIHKLAPLLHKAIAQARVSGTYYPGFWSDIGTPERLQALEIKLSLK